MRMKVLLKRAIEIERSFATAEGRLWIPYT
jgi:hypothetical protein